MTYLAVYVCLSLACLAALGVVAALETRAADSARRRLDRARHEAGLDGHGGERRMKTTFLVRDGLCQVVLHPETPVERAVLDLVSSDQSVEVHRAQFTEIQGGYIRDFSRFSTSPFDSPAHLPDTVLVLRPKEPKVVAPGPKVAHLVGTLRLIRDQYVENRGDMLDPDALSTIAALCTEALGDRP